LRSKERLELSEDPDSLEARLPAAVEWVYIDEIQKVPQLLDTVHRLIEERKIKFAMTGSSARRLKAGAANLLAGRAFVYELFPLTSYELGPSFELMHALSWGTLPKLLQLQSIQDKKEFLEAYTLTYLQEEIWEEHLVRNLLPFRKFLQVAAQANGKVINYSKIAQDVRVDTKSVQQYFQILEDTLLGFFLEPHHASLRKRQRANPKFYLFDVGIWRALTCNFMLEIAETSLGFGNVFEHFLIAELRALNRSLKRGYEFFFYRKDDTLEVDLVIERPHLPLALVEIKSHQQILEKDVESLLEVAKSYPNAEIFCFSRDETVRRYGRATCLPWRAGIEVLGLKP
jgi:predicted AAA+ superfamily ATPase